MSARSRAQPWFAPTIEQRLVWDNPGSSICPHGMWVPAEDQRLSCIRCAFDAGHVRLHGALGVPESVLAFMLGGPRL